MDCWSELEIDATQDLKSIKRAYAKKLKTIDRASDIEGFQQLRSAYDLARHLATGDLEKAVTLSSSEPDASKRVTPTDIIGAETQVSAEFMSTEVDPPEQDFREVWQQVDAYLTQVDELLHNDSLKNNADAWKPLWTHEVFEQLRTKEILYEELFGYFIRVTPSIDAITAGDNFMPSFVLPRYGTLFSWQSDEIGLAERFDEDDVDRILLLSSDDHIQGKLQSAERGTSNVGKIYLWATIVIVAAMYIKSRFF